MESDPECYNVLKRVHFAFAPTGMVLEGPYSIETEAIEQAGKIVLEPLTSENTMQYSLVVVDEAHNVFTEAANATFIKRSVTQKHTELLVPSDTTQGAGHSIVSVRRHNASGAHRGGAQHATDCGT